VRAQRLIVSSGTTFQVRLRVVCRLACRGLHALHRPAGIQAPMPPSVGYGVLVTSPFPYDRQTRKAFSMCNSDNVVFTLLLVLAVESLCERTVHSLFSGSDVACPRNLAAPDSSLVAKRKRRRVSTKQHDSASGTAPAPTPDAEVKPEDSAPVILIKAIQKLVCGLWALLILPFNEGPFRAASTFWVSASRDDMLATIVRTVLSVAAHIHFRFTVKHGEYPRKLH
jgi:hypothetical protein